MPTFINLQNALITLPAELAETIEEEYIELVKRFSRNDWGPTQMNGGRFGEAILRYIEFKNTGTYTKIGIQLNRLSIVNQAKNNTNLSDSIRFHIPNCTDILMDIRNKRDVAHLGKKINVHEMDSILIFRVASWVLSEIIRLESAISTNRIQELIDSLSKKQIPLVEEIGGDLLVVGTHLKAIDRALIALYYKNPADIASLQKSTQYKHSSRFLSLLEDKQTEGIVYIKNNAVYLTNKGSAWVETNIDMSLTIP